VPAVRALGLRRGDRGADRPSAAGICKIASYNQLPYILRSATPGCPSGSFTGAANPHRPGSSTSCSRSRATTGSPCSRNAPSPSICRLFDPPDEAGARPVSTTDLGRGAPAPPRQQATANDIIDELTSECFNGSNQLREYDGPIGSPSSSTSGWCGFVERRAANAKDMQILRSRRAGHRLRPGGAGRRIARSKQSLWRGAGSGRCSCNSFNETWRGRTSSPASSLAGAIGAARRCGLLPVPFVRFQGRYAIRGGELELIKIVDASRPICTRGWSSPTAPPPASPLTSRCATRGRTRTVGSRSPCSPSHRRVVGLRLSLDNRAGALYDASGADR